MKQHNTSRHPILIAVAIALLVSGCTKESAPVVVPVPAKVAVQEAAPSHVAGLKMLDFALDKNKSGKSVVKGNVSNSSTQKIDHAAAEFQLLDKDGKEIGKAMAAVDNLGAQFSWAFEAEISQGNVASVKFVGFK